MLMINSIKKLTVSYNGKIVGFLAETKNNEIAFQYDEDWITSGFSISPFSLPLDNRIYICKNDSLGGLYGVFHDSLPDGWGALLQLRALRAQGVNVNKLSPLTRLSLIDSSGLGALKYEPTQCKENPQALNDLDKIAKDVLLIYDNAVEDVDLDSIYRLGGSSAGARPKAHIIDNGGFWIVKFPCTSDSPDVGSEEFHINELAVQCGINTNIHKLFPSKKCAGYFGAKRFDRLGNKGVHTISLSSILETSHKIPNLDYIHLFQVIEKICSDKNDIIEAYKRMCFNVIAHNCDDHGRNFAFVFDDKLHSYKLSPAFDLTKTHNMTEHEMTVCGKGNPSENDLLEIGKFVQIPKHKCLEIINLIKSVVLSEL